MHARSPEFVRFAKRSVRQGSWPLLQRYAVFPRILDEPPIELPDPSLCEFSVHVLVCEKDATMLHWCLRSLLHHSQTPFSVYIHDDGSCGSPTLERFRTSFVNAVVLPRHAASEMVEPQLSEFPELIRWRRDDYIAAKCLDFYLIGQEEWVIILDGDVLFFNEPIDLFESSSSSLWMRDCFYSPYIDPDEANAFFQCTPMPVSGGLGRVRRSIADLALLREVQQFKTQPHVVSRANQRGLPRFEDQTYHALLTGRQGDGEFLGSAYQVATEPGLQGVIAKHFTTPARFWLFEEGIPRVARQLPLGLPRWLRERG